MDRALVWLIIVLIALATVLFGISAVNDSVSQRMNAQSSLVVAQGQASLDRAQAYTMITGAMFPWLVLGLVGLGFMGTIVAIVFLVSSRPSERIIERYLIAGSSKREMFKMISNIDRSDILR